MNKILIKLKSKKEIKSFKGKTCPSYVTEEMCFETLEETADSTLTSSVNFVLRHLSFTSSNSLKRTNKVGPRPSN